MRKLISCLCVLLLALTIKAITSDIMTIIPYFIEDVHYDHLDSFITLNLAKFLFNIGCLVSCSLHMF